MNAGRRKFFPIGLVAAFVMSGGLAVWGQEKPTSPSSAVGWVDQIKSPVDLFKWGADFRLRNDSSVNPYLTEADPPGHSYSFERLRLREWNTFSPSTEFEFNLRLTWEGRHYWKPASKEEWDESEVVFDNFFGKFKFQDMPLTLILGRQDIVFGEGWLVSDGTPLDGPRTNYFDAVRATIDLKEIKSVLDLIFINQTSSPNHWLRPIASKSKPLMEQDERGAIAYFSNKSSERSQIDAYFIFKHDEAILPNGDNGDVYTFGGAFARDFNSNVSDRFEGAYQFGNRKNLVMFPNQGSSLSAFGFNNRLTYSFRDPLKRQIWLGCEILSGSDAHDSSNHQFDPLWGRWAKYSELFPNDLDRASDRNNLERINLGYQVEPADGMLIQANYHALFTYTNRHSDVPGFSNHGTFKGHLLTALLRYKFNRAWSGHLRCEYFIPGNYYEKPADSGSLDTRRDPASFLRAEIIFAF